MLVEKLPSGFVTEGQRTVYRETIMKNPYLINEDIQPYAKQSIALFLINSPEKTDKDGLKKPNTILCGAGGFGGKTYLGSMMALQHLLNDEEGYTCLVTRKNYAELLDTNSIWDNLLDWCCNDDLHDDYKCEYKKSPTPQISAPNGNTIYFKAFDREEKKQKFKSASYDRIINDEASELPNEVLRFQYRSSRNTSRIPRSIINLSNPGGDSTQYLVEQFVDGEKPYIPMDWRDNPFIDKNAYEGSLNELDYIDQQYQKYGNWHYKPAKGDLISRSEAESQYVLNITTPYVYSLMGIDLAGKGRDMFAIVSYDYLNNGLEYVHDFAQTQSANPEGMLISFLSKHNPNPSQPKTSIIVIEQEGGGSPEYARKYFQNIILEAGYNIPVVLRTPSGSKYQRARPLVHGIKFGNVKLNKQGHYMDDFIDEMVQLDPTGKGRSPNLVDSCSLARNYLHDKVLGNKTSFKTGRRIG